MTHEETLEQNREDNLTQKEEAWLHNAMRETVALEIKHRARASQACNRREAILEVLRHRFTDPEEAPPGGWPNVEPDDLTDLRTTISYEGTRNIHDKLLTIAHWAGPRQLGVGQLAQLLVSAGQYRHNRGSVQNQVRAALVEKPELYERTSVNTFRYRWA